MKLHGRFYLPRLAFGCVARLTSGWSLGAIVYLRSCIFEGWFGHRKLIWAGPWSSWKRRSQG